MRTPQRDENGLKKGPWTAEEDQKLIAYIKRYRIWNWSLMPKFAGLSRNGKSCRLRWVNYLNPELKQGKISKEEEDTIISMYTKLGSRWSAIAARLPGRTDNQIKNYWHTHLKKRFKHKHVPIIKAEGIEIRNFEGNVLNSSESNITTGISSPEESNSEGLSNFAMTPSVLVVESSSSSVGSTVGSVIPNEIDDASVDSLKLNGDLHSFWTQPFSYENLYMVKENETYDQEWYLEPLSPYGFYNNEYWFDMLLSGNRDGWNVNVIA